MGVGTQRPCQPQEPTQYRESDDQSTVQSQYIRKGCGPRAKAKRGVRTRRLFK
jgi:hypothetical protein